ncbi:MAG: hypothetical protein ACPG4V_15610 [Limisphaerales bacterium]
MNILTPSIFGCALLLTAGCIVIAPNHGGKRQTESEEVVEMDTSTVKRTIIIEHATSASDAENNTESSKTVQQTIIINGEEKQQDDLESLPPEIQEILRKHGVKISE